VTHSDVLDIRADNRRATIIADLTSAPGIADSTFDAIICTQTLHLIHELRAAVGTLHRVLKPRGVLLATVPGVSRISVEDMSRGGDHWRLTSASALRVFEEAFGAGCVGVWAWGNVLTAIAFLEGVACEELTPEEFDATDPAYEVVVGVRAVKRG
jgi:SAM-dependent methyltransferase